MYRSFYGLKKKPFQISTNPSFLWLGEMHKEALAHLKYGIIESQGFLLLTGDVGTGKTTLINALIDSLGDEFIVARVPDPGMETIDFMNFIAHLFDMNKKFVSKDGFLIHFGHFLNSANAAGKKVILIIDESQRLSSDLLEEIRQLSNIENQGNKLLNIFLIGQNEFNDVLQETKNRALHQRISLNYVIKPLDVDETGEYIRHRLKMAGTEKEIFSSEAIRSVHESSGGIPRRINIICDHSLLYGFYMETKTISGDVVRECVKDLLLPQSSEKTNTEPFDLVDGASSQNLKAIPSEGSQEKGPSSVKRTIGTVILCTIVVFIVTYIIYPTEYQNFFSRFRSNKPQVFSVSQGTNSSSFNNHPESDTKTAAIKNLSTKSEMKISDEGSIDLSVAKELPVENVKPASVVLKDDSTEDLPDKPAASVPAEDLPAIDPIEESNDDEVNLASTPLGGTSPADQQDVTGEDVSLKLPVFSETVVNPKSETGSDHNDIEINEKIVTLENSALIVDTPVTEKETEKETTGVTDALETGASDENENEDEELTSTKTDSRVDSELEEYLTQNKRNNLPAESVAAEEIANEDPEDMDPSAVIDWVLKKRSE
ncbi:MAG: AAA family ATPase [Desulforhopalus sp.]|nr:AAA family ATPase [Desulforhopalus sp.]